MGRGALGSRTLMETAMHKREDGLIKLTAGVVMAYVGANTTAASELPSLIKNVHDALQGADTPVFEPSPPVPPFKPTPAQIRKSITPEALISFIDGRPYKTLKRHLGVHGMTVQEYKARYGLPANYPTTASAYSAVRSAAAKAIGLGRGRS
jgi:predicted transcriptional regulator